MGPTGVRTKIADSDQSERVLIISDEASIAKTLHLAEAMQAAGHSLDLMVQLDQLSLQQPIREALAFVASRVALLSDEPDAQFDPTSTSMVCHPFDWSSMDAIMQTWLFDQSYDRMCWFMDVSSIKRLKAWYGEDIKAKLGHPKVLASVNGPMQCMLKGVCAQCFQWQIDPDTGKRSKAVFGCSWQDEPLELIDLDHLNSRQQNQASYQAVLAKLHLESAPP
jgi:hypothetical protein